MGSRVGVASSLALVAICAVAGVSALATDALAQTQRRVFDPPLVESRARIPYRALTRDDFRAAKRPDEVAATHGRLGALTCVDLTTHPDLFIRATSEGNDAQLGRVRARVHNLAFTASMGNDAQLGRVRARVHNLAFTASMDRDCSWWNPQHVGLPHEYIREHEQIHFALFEIAARRLNQQAARIQERVEAVARTQDEAIDEVQRRLDAELRAAFEQVKLRSDDLDRQTSFAYRRARQRWWYRQVDEELSRLPVDAQRR